MKNWVIKKRTFEGEINPEKNNKALTSKYYPSKKYVIIFNDWYEKIFRTKKEATEFLLYN